MGGGGSYYDRDVTDRSLRTPRGYSKVAEEKMSRSKADEASLPKGRKLVCQSKNPIVYAFDVTGSMGTLPKTIYDKMPMMAGQIVEQKYLDDPMISLAAVGDLVSDRAPIQVCDFSLVRDLDSWLQRIWLEGCGGPTAEESYELTAYFYANMVEIPNATMPIFLFTGDEGFRESLSATDLNRHFGGKHEAVESSSVFNQLKEKFKGNVFLIHRHYPYQDEEIVRQWKRVLGKEKVIILGDDSAIADVTLGLFAIVSGKRTLDEYLQDMRNRKQTDDRIASVEQSLRQLADSMKTVTRPRVANKSKERSPKRKRPGRI